jgi:hypothetical protein
VIGGRGAVPRPRDSAAGLLVDQGGGSREGSSASPLTQHLRNDCPSASVSIPAVKFEPAVIRGSRPLDPPVDLRTCKAAPLPHHQSPITTHLSPCVSGRRLSQSIAQGYVGLRQQFLDYFTIACVAYGDVVDLTGNVQCTGAAVGDDARRKKNESDQPPRLHWKSSLRPY